MFSLAITGAAAFAVSLAALPAAMWAARRMGMVDHPAHRKIHREPVPFLGGVAVFAGFTAAIAGVFLFSPEILRPAYSGKLIAVVTVGLLGMAIGLLDDRFQLRPRHKLCLQMAVLLAFTCLGYRLEVLRLPGLEPVSLGVFSVPLTLFWMLALVNGMNLVDGVDGLAGTVAFCTLGMAAIVASHVKDPAALSLSAAGMGAVLAFLLLNWRPARIFLGDAGSTGLGMFITALLVSLGSHGAPFILQTASASDVPALLKEPLQFQLPAVTMLALYPALEVSLSVLRRLLRGKAIGSADRAHIHHKLLNMGWSPPRICLAAAAMTVLGGLVVLTSQGEARGAAAWILLVVGLGIGLLLHFCGYLQAIHPETVRDIRPHFLAANHFASMQRAKLELAHSIAEVLGLAQQACLEFNVHSLRLQLDGSRHNRAGIVHDWRHPRAGESLPGGAPAAAMETLKRDQILAEDSGSSAEWRFLPRVLEEDIDVEHRVLLHGFMERALRRADALFAASGAYEKIHATAADSAVLSSGSLRARARRNPAADATTG